MLSRGTRGARMPAIAALAIALAAPASAATDGVVAACPPSTYEQPFTPWLDLASYVLAPNGGLESDADGWSLDGDAAVIAENERFDVHGPSDTKSLSLPSGSTATTSIHAPWAPLDSIASPSAVSRSTGLSVVGGDAGRHPPSASFLPRKDS